MKPQVRVRSLEKFGVWELLFKVQAFVPETVCLPFRKRSGAGGLYGVLGLRLGKGSDSSRASRSPITAMPKIATALLLQVATTSAEICGSFRKYMTLI